MSSELEALPLQGPSERITFELRCSSCDYDLRTLAVDAICPECASPVKQSILLRGFNFRSIRVAIRTRRGLKLLVLASLVGVFNAIGFTIVLRYSHVVEAWGVFRPVVKVWQVVGLVGMALHMTAVLLIAFPFGGLQQHRRPLMGVVTTSLACIPVLFEVAWFVLLISQGVQTAVNLLETAVLSGLTLWFVWPSGPVSMVLLWIILTSSVNRVANRGLWRLSCVAVAAMVSCLLDDTLEIIDDLDTRMGWFYMPLDVWELSEWWEKYVGTPCWIVMLLVVWALLRSMDAAWRAPTDGRRFTADAAD